MLGSFATTMQTGIWSWSSQRFPTHRARHNLHAVFAKYVDALPLYRQERIDARSRCWNATRLV